MYTNDILSIFKTTEFRVDRIIKSFESNVSVIINRERSKRTYIYNIGAQNIERSLKREFLSVKKEISELLAESLIRVEKRINAEYQMDYDRGFVSTIYDSIIESINAQLLKMINIAVRLVRTEAVKIRREKKKLNSNLEDAFTEVKRKTPFVEPIMYFRDKSSRKWKINKYFSMLIRSLIYTFSREMVFEIAIENEIDVLEIHPTGDKMKLSEYDTLKDEGVFHPNSQKLFRIRSQHES